MVRELAIKRGKEKGSAKKRGDSERFMFGMLDIASVFGVSKMSISNWVKEGMPRESRGLYDVRQCAAWLEARRKAEVDARLSNLGSDEAETRYRLAKAESAELDLAAKKGDFVPLDMVLGVWEQEVGAAKAKLLSLPSRMATLLLGCRDRIQIRDILAEEIEIALNELADRTIDRGKPKRASRRSTPSPTTYGAPHGTKGKGHRSKRTAEVEG